MPIPSEVVSEAIDHGPINRDFKAKFTKHIRRKLLSSGMEGNSCVLIFENSSLKEGKLVGGPYWKSCIQKGVGKKFHRIYLDDVSTGQLIKSLKSGLCAAEFKEVFKAIFNEFEKGIPILTDDWVEFPGWFKNPDKSIRAITEKRLKIPTASLFQKAFTEELIDLGEFVGPIDFFDGLDAILLKVFSRNEFRHLKNSYLYVSSLRDSDKHPYRVDSRIVPRLEDTDIPLVTVSAIFISILALWKMYENDPIALENEYAPSLKNAQSKIAEWCS
jgi:hypothetical protein